MLDHSDGQVELPCNADMCGKAARPVNKWQASHGGRTHQQGVGVGTPFVGRDHDVVLAIGHIFKCGRLHEGKVDRQNQDLRVIRQIRQ